LGISWCFGMISSQIHPRLAHSDASISSSVMCEVQEESEASGARPNWQSLTVKVTVETGRSCHFICSNSAADKNGGKKKGSEHGQIRFHADFELASVLIQMRGPFQTVPQDWQCDHRLCRIYISVCNQISARFKRHDAVQVL